MKKWILLLLMSCISCGDSYIAPENAFIVNREGNTILKCPYVAKAINFTQCMVLSVEGLTHPVALAFNTLNSLSDPRVYISNYDGTPEGNQILQCQYLSGLFTGCEKAPYTGYDFPVNLTLRGNSLFVPSYSNNQLMTFNAQEMDAVANSNITMPTAVYFTTFNNVLVTSQSDTDTNKILSCSSDGVSISNCTTALDLGTDIPLSIGSNGAYYYFTIANANRVLKCEYAKPLLTSCIEVGDDALYNYPYGITFQDNKAYVPNRQSGVNSIVVCNVGKNGAFTSCTLETASALLDGPTWVVFQ